MLHLILWFFLIFWITSLILGLYFANAHCSLLDSLFYIIHGLVLCYPCLQNVNFHHPGPLLGLVFPCDNKYKIRIRVIDVTGAFHLFTFAPHADVSDLRSQINTKLRIESSLYWLSSSGKPLYNGKIKLQSLNGLIIMNGRLLGGMLCSIRGCTNIAGDRKFDSMLGTYELKVSLCIVINDIDIRHNKTN